MTIDHCAPPAKPKRLYLVWWDNGESYSDWAAKAEIVESVLSPAQLRKKLLSQFTRKDFFWGWDCVITEYIRDATGGLVMVKDKRNE